MITIILGIENIGERCKGVGGRPKEISWEHSGALQLWAAASVSPASISAWRTLRPDTLPAASTTHIHPWVGFLLCKGGSWDLLSWANQAKHVFPQGFASSLGQNSADAGSFSLFTEEIPQRECRGSRLKRDGMQSRRGKSVREEKWVQACAHFKLLITKYIWL